MAEQGIFSKKTVCVVTGASRGLGRAIVLQFAVKLPAESLFVLLARDVKSLTAVKQDIGALTSDVQVVIRAYDQGSLDQGLFNFVLTEALNEASAQATDFEQAIIVHNAGSLRPIQPVREHSDVNGVSNYFNINLTGVVTLNSSFMKTFAPVPSGVVINISSLCALQPFKTWSLYCAGKAARDMFFRCLAAEESPYQVLNYAPGPLKTDMFDVCLTTPDPEVKAMFQEMEAKKTFLTPEQSAEKLIAILEKNSFTSGAHVDYYDQI